MTDQQEVKAGSGAHELERIENEPVPEKLGDGVDLEDDPHRAALEDNPNKADTVTWSTIAAIFFLGFSYASVIGVDFLIVSGVSNPIAAALGDTENVGWIMSSWSLASSVSFPLAGAISDIIGRRYVILFGQGLLVLSGIVAATAKTTNTVIAAQTLSGFSAGSIFVCYAGIAEILPNRYRGVGLAWTEFCMTMPWGTLSAMIGGELVQKASWRWVFYIAIITAAVALIGTALTYFPPPPEKIHHLNKTRMQRIKELDYLGISLYAGGLTAFLLGILWAGTTAHPWNSASVIAPIVVGFMVFLSVFAYDWTIAKNPFFPLDLFKRFREFTLTLIVLAVCGMIFYSMAHFLPQATRYFYTIDSIELGIIQLPNGIGQFIGGAILPSLIHKMGNVRIQILVGLAIQTVFTALYCLGVPDHKAAWMAFQFFGQMCFAWVVLACYVVVGLHVPHRQLGLATGLVGTFRNGGGSVGTAIFTAVLNGVLPGQLTPRISEAAVAAGFPSQNLSTLIPVVLKTAGADPSILNTVPGMTPTIAAACTKALKDAYAYAFQRVFLSTIPFGVIAFIAALFIKDVSKYLTNHTAVHMEKGVLGHEKHEGHELPADGRTPV